MQRQSDCPGRRKFLKAAAISACGALCGAPQARAAASDEVLRVWSCGGLAEAMMPANMQFEAQTGVKVAYTGAFAAALGKSLMGSATTDVFAGRVLDLAKKLRAAGKMVHFEPLCFTQYVLVTPPGNPAGIKSVEDLAKPGVKVVLAPDASPPGGAASLALLKKAGVLEAAKKKCRHQRNMRATGHGRHPVRTRRCVGGGAPGDAPATICRPDGYRAHR